MKVRGEVAFRVLERRFDLDLEKLLRRIAEKADRDAVSTIMFMLWTPNRLK